MTYAQLLCDISGCNHAATWVYQDEHQMIHLCAEHVHNRDEYHVFPPLESAE